MPSVWLLNACNIMPGVGRKTYTAQVVWFSNKCCKASALPALCRLSGMEWRQTASSHCMHCCSASSLQVEQYGMRCKQHHVIACIAALTLSDYGSCVHAQELASWLWTSLWTSSSSTCPSCWHPSAAARWGIALSCPPGRQASPSHPPSFVGLPQVLPQSAGEEQYLEINQYPSQCHGVDFREFFAGWDLFRRHQAFIAVG